MNSECSWRRRNWYGGVGKVEARAGARARRDDERTVGGEATACGGGGAMRRCDARAQRAPGTIEERDLEIDLAGKRLKSIAQMQRLDQNTINELQRELQELHVERDTIRQSVHITNQFDFKLYK